MTEHLNDRSEDAVVRLAAVFGWPRVLGAIAESPALERMMRELAMVEGDDVPLPDLPPADAVAVLEAMDKQFAGLAVPMHK